MFQLIAVVLILCVSLSDVMAYNFPSYRKNTGNPSSGDASTVPAAQRDESGLSEAEKIKREWLKNNRSTAVERDSIIGRAPSSKKQGSTDNSSRHSIRSDISSLSDGSFGAHSIASERSSSSRYSGSSNVSAISTASKLSGITPLGHSFKADASKKGPILILSIDGAAVRGLVQLRILQILEARLQKELGEPGLRITDVFDIFAGTSAGSINAAGLMSPATILVAGTLDLPLTGEAMEPRFLLNKATIDPMTGQEETLNDLAKRIIDNVFRPSHKKRLRDIRVLGGLAGSKYSIKPLEKTLQDITFIGKTKEGTPLYATMADTVKPTVITAWDVNNREVINFNTFDACREPMSSRMNPDLWFAARASASAPVFFKPLELHDRIMVTNKDGHQEQKEITRALIDAGLYVMSPTIVAWAEAMKIYPERNYVIFSIGGGFTTKARNLATKGNTAGAIPQILKPAIESALEGQPRLVERVLSMVPGITYLRLNFEVQNSSFDDVSDKNLKSLNDTAEAVVKTEQFQFIVKTLVDAIKKQRADKTKKPYKKCVFNESLDYSRERFSARFTSNNLSLDAVVIPEEGKNKGERKILSVETALEGQNTEPQVITL